MTDLRVAVFQNCQSGTFDNRNLVARKTVRAQQIADFHFYQFQKFRIVYLVYLVHVNDNRRYTYLTSQKNVFARLRHRTVSRRYDQNRTVHLRRTRNHVLYIVRVTRAVYVRIVTLRRFVLYV